MLVKSAKIECLKMMSFTVLEDFDRLAEESPGMGFVVRLYDGRFGKGHHPTPAEFAGTFIPIMEELGTYAIRFEVHNEPNHLEGIEGWGQEDHHAHDFNNWFLEVYDMLKQACPWAELGFPGLALHHRDLEWLDICRPAIEKAEWLGVHCYWQNPTPAFSNHMANYWGLWFKEYHERFPDKPLEITEFGNSNGQGGYPVLPHEIALEYEEYYQELFKYPYLRSASAFIVSAPQEEWADFTWRHEHDGFKQVVGLVGDMPRPPLFGEESAPEPPPEPEPIPPEPEAPPSEPEGVPWNWLIMPRYALNLAKAVGVNKRSDGTVRIQLDRPHDDDVDLPPGVAVEGRYILVFAGEYAEMIVARLGL